MSAEQPVARMGWVPIERYAGTDHQTCETPRCLAAGLQPWSVAVWVIVGLPGTAEDGLEHVIGYCAECQAIAAGLLAADGDTLAAAELRTDTASPPDEWTVPGG